MRACMRPPVRPAGAPQAGARAAAAHAGILVRNDYRRKPHAHRSTAIWLSACAASVRRTNHGDCRMSIQHQRLIELCNELRLGGIAAQYASLAQKAAEQHISFTDFAEELLVAERESRRAR